MDDLHNLLTSPNQSLDVQAMKLVKLLPMLFQEAVQTYLFNKKSSYGTLRDIILRIQERIESLDIEKLTSLVFVVVVIGGAPLTNLRGTLERVKESTRSNMLERLQALLTRKYSSNIAEWMCHEWQLLENQTLNLINYLIKTKTEGKKNYNILTLSRAVHISDNISDFVVVSKGFLCLSSSKMVLDWLKEARNNKM
jgi:hypothetical protein